MVGQENTDTMNQWSDPMDGQMMKSTEGKLILVERTSKIINWILIKPVEDFLNIVWNQAEINVESKPIFSWNIKENVNMIDVREKIRS